MGGMGVNTSFNRLSNADWSPAAARHLLMRTGFGPTPAETRAAYEAGLSASVTTLLDFDAPGLSDMPDPEIDSDVIRPLTIEERQMAQDARRSGNEAARSAIRRRINLARRDDRRMHQSLQDWWRQRMIDTPRPAQENLTLLWHSHFATRHRDIRDAYLMYQQNQMFRANAAGNFADLARGIVHDPAMLKFLNNDRNLARKPNENLARELMELFTLGEGEYGERDIKQGARALTGYHVNDNEFTFRRRVHDDDVKQILGKTGEFDGDDFVELLLAQRACSRFIAYKLYRHFVVDVSDDPETWDRPTQAAIDQTAKLLVKHDYEIMPVLTTLLMSQHFYDPAIVGRKIKCPTRIVVGTARSMGTPPRSDTVMRTAMALMGQDLFDPPSVAGWDIGRAWINTSTLFARQNTATYLITGKVPGDERWSRDDMAYDPTALLEGVDRTPDATVHHLADTLLGEHVAGDKREPLLAFMRQRTKGVTPDAVAGLLVLISAMPEYQLC